MAKVRKRPYYQMVSSGLPFTASKWKCYMGSIGCVPINTPQTISYERLAPGEAPPPRAPKPTAEQIKLQQAEAARQKALAAQAAKQQQQEKSKQPPAPKPQELDAEDHETLPAFDLQDIPGAMDKIGWPMSAKVARKWFANPVHIYDDKPDSIQPIDSTSVSLNWALKYGNVKSRLNNLLEEDIYSKNATAIIKRKILAHVNNTFTLAESTKSALSIDTEASISDLRKFHLDWQFQQKKVSTFDTFDGRLLTDLSGTLGNFLLYAAVGRVEVTGERFFNYESNPHQYCLDSTAKLTHIYIYLKDNYSFNDKDPSKSQYLGHWNKRDMISSYLLGANELLGQIEPGWKLKINGGNIEEYHLNWNYLPNKNEVDKPVDTRRGIFGKFAEKDVYWPVYNKTYNEWRKKHKRGGDFMIYSKPQLYKLKKPIIIKLDTVCRPYDSIFINQ